MARRFSPSAPPAALYHRVSTLDQNASLARTELRAAARARGFRVELDVEEKGSGARNDRPGLQRVLDAARRNRVRAVLVWKLDRWGRSALDVLTNVQQLRDAGVRFICASQGIDVGPGSGAAGDLVLTVLGAVAQFERALIRERTHLGLARAQAQGRRPGRPRRMAPELPARVIALRRARRSWASIARELKCSASSARRAYSLARRR